jgi:hypothetical protein
MAKTVSISSTCTSSNEQMEGYVAEILRGYHLG